MYNGINTVIKVPQPTVTAQILHKKAMEVFEDLKDGNFDLLLWDKDCEEFATMTNIGDQTVLPNSKVKI